MKNYISLIFILALSVSVMAEIKTEEVNYKIDSQQFTGYMAWDDSIDGKRPGVLVVHEWWGHNDYARKRAEMLAALGYTAFALDLYGKGKLATHPDDAKSFMMAATNTFSMVENRVQVATNLLQNHPSVDGAKLAAIGYCMGGGVVLNMARAGADFAAVVSFHGSLGAKTQVKKGAVKAKILVLNGADDPFVPADAIAAFKKEMSDAGADMIFHNYPGAKHSFTNPDADTFGEKFKMPLAYDEEADDDSWRKMKALFDEVF